MLLLKGLGLSGAESGFVLCVVFVLWVSRAMVGWLSCCVLAVARNLDPLR